MLSAFSYPMPAAAQSDSLSVASAFLDALKTGDVDRIRGQITPDAMFAAGDVGGPLAGAVSALAGAEFRKCAIGPLRLERETTKPDLFGDETPLSIKAGGAQTVNSVLSCPNQTGGTRETPMTLVVAGARVAFVGFGRSKMATRPN